MVLFLCFSYANIWFMSYLYSQHLKGKVTNLAQNLGLKFSCLRYFLFSLEKIIFEASLLAYSLFQFNPSF